MSGKVKLIMAAVLCLGIVCTGIAALGGIVLKEAVHKNSFPSLSEQDVTEAVKLQLEEAYEGFEGWGTSIAWWGHALGGWEDQEKVRQVMDMLFDREKGIGLNIVRYNIGGGEKPGEHTLRPGGDVPGFQPEAGLWDWEADANQRYILQESLRRGVTIAEAFSNSPPYWMTVSGSVSGAEDRGNNLRDDQYDAFADYLTEVVRHFRDEWGITFRTLDPLNEPSSNWWRKGNIQEGCYFDLGKQGEIIRKVAASLEQKGLNGTVVSANDDNSIDETLEALHAYDAATLEAIGQINTHSYNGSRMEELRAFAQGSGKRLWMSEYGTGGSAPHHHEDMTSVMELAQRIMFDLKMMKPAAWIYWQAVEDEGADNNWGFIHANFTGEESYELTKQYYAMAQFSKFIAPGSRIIPADDGRVLAAYDAAAGQLTVVVRNELSDRKVTVDLSPFTYDAGAAQVEAYRTSGQHNLEPAAELVELFTNGVTVPVDSESIVTVVISGVAPVAE
ncbi:glycoside hydrolase family 30 protein [Paenibacillus fonticola]|uniref:glycoside hydrolase family 30 protein n=1 Tax=Paenibacillus fonticola TaxID=379896 RepID=UPI000368B0A3|nr:glycoside hydrolase [Paenibacillus fonticola]